MKTILFIICCFFCFSAVLASVGVIVCIILSIKGKYCPRFPWEKM